MIKALAIDSDLNLFVIEISDIRSHPKGRVMNKFNLLKDSTFFETFYVKTEGSSHLLNELNEDKAMKAEQLFHKLNQMSSEKNFLKYDKDTSTLYTVLRLSASPENQAETTLITWNLDIALHHYTPKIPLAASPMRLFSSSSPNE